MKLSELIKSRRLSLGLSQQAVAKSVGVSRQSVGLWETGETGPKRGNIPALARVLKLKKAALDPLLSQGLIEVDVTSEQAKVALLNFNDLFDGGKMEQAALTSPRISLDWEASPKCFALTIPDESMRPDYNIGDIIVIDPTIDPADQDDVVVRIVDDKVILRRYQSRGA